MEIVEIAAIDDNSSAIETGVDSNVISNTQGSVTPRLGCGEEGEGSTVISTTPTMPSISTPTTLVAYTPGGSEQWISRIEEKFTPVIGKTFVNLESAMMFYEIYAIACGFKARKSSTKRFRNGDVRTKCMVCHREGFNKRKRRPPLAGAKTDVETCEQFKEGEKTAKPKPVAKTAAKKRGGGDEAESSNKQTFTRITKIKRWGCQAMVKFKFEDNMFKVEQFKEGHNHPLTLVRNREFEKLAENINTLNEYHKQLIIQNSRANVGASLTYNLCKEQAEGFENVGASLMQFKNFQRNVKCLLNGKDGHMFISRLETLRDTKGLEFAYETDSDGALTRIFWTDAESKRAYALFGEGFSFDPTYGTNKYNMKFTPFTGIDHHKKSITFACALLDHEDDGAFIWAFQQFLKAMGGKEPHYVITDQDAAIMLAVPAVFKTARHRFCMWHIMKKVTDKVGSTICKETDFLSRLNDVVWNDDVEPEEFEEKWAKVISDFSLEENKWLKSKFAERDQWIPAYFRNVPMGNILKTTQRSESTNSFFKRFENKYGTLVEFWMRFESAMDQQRHNLKLLEAQSDNSMPETKFGLRWENHAVKVYTHEVFSDFQKEVQSSINACSVCGYTQPDPVTNFEVSMVEDANKRKRYAVGYNMITMDVSCTCKLFERKGILCNHIIWICSGKFKEIPEKYILRRWSKNALRNPVHDSNGNLLENHDSTGNTKFGMPHVWSEIYATLGILKRKEESDMRAFAKLIKEFRKKLEPNPKPLTKEQELEVLLNCKVPKEVKILPPKVSRNKGSGKRLVSSKNKAIMKAKKPKRLCAKCKRMSHHDKRNCPNDFAEHPPEKQGDTSGEDEEDEEDEDEEEE